MNDNLQPQQPALGKKVFFAEREYILAPLPIRKSRAWREQFSAKLDGLFSLVKGFQGSSVEDLASGSLDSILPLLESLKGYLAESTDILLELVYAFSPNIKADQEWIENNATDPEVFAVFMEVLRIAYPFGNVLEKLTSLGQDIPTTSMSSLEVNGDSGPTN